MIKILGYLKRIRKDIALSMIFIVLGQTMTLLLPLLMSMIINKGIKNADMDYIKLVGLQMIVVSALGVAISSLSSFYSSRTATSYGKILRETLFLKVETLSQVDIDTIGTPSLITRCTNDVKVMQDFVLHSMRMIISAPIMLIGGTIMAFFLNAKLAWDGDEIVKVPYFEDKSDRSNPYTASPNSIHVVPCNDHTTVTYQGTDAWDKWGKESTTLAPPYNTYPRVTCQKTVDEHSWTNRSD